MVNITSCYDDFFDGTCILEAGDHPFITHRSYVKYAEAVVSNAEQVAQGIGNGQLVSYPQLSEEVFERVFAGLAKSLDTPINVLNYLRIRKAA